jgi:chitinase
MVDGPVIWTSNLDGQIGTGLKFKSSQLSVGRHTIIASVKDKKGEDAVDTLELTIEKFSWAAHYKKHFN